MHAHDNYTALAMDIGVTTVHWYSLYFDDQEFSILFSAKYFSVYFLLLMPTSQPLKVLTDQATVFHTACNTYIHHSLNKLYDTWSLEHWPFHCNFNARSIIISHMYLVSITNINKKQTICVRNFSWVLLCSIEHSDLWLLEEYRLYKANKM